METTTALYMIPVAISDAPQFNVIPSYNADIILHVKHFIVENIRTARRCLKKMVPDIDISSLDFQELNGHTPENEISGYLNPLRNGESIGVMSEAGCPGVADPGASVALLAQLEGFKVIPLVGPSSILMALMASGLNGQNFAFHGYLPVESSARNKAIRDYEAQSRRNDMTQIFIETPYRNVKLLESLVKNLAPETLLCVASDITSLSSEKIVTKPIKKWREKEELLGKVPTIFMFYSPNPR